MLPLRGRNNVSFPTPYVNSLVKSILVAIQRHGPCVHQTNVNAPLDVMDTLQPRHVQKRKHTNLGLHHSQVSTTTIGRASAAASKWSTFQTPSPESARKVGAKHNDNHAVPSRLLPTQQVHRRAHQRQARGTELEADSHSTHSHFLTWQQMIDIKCCLRQFF